MICLLPIMGLCNRMRAIDSAVALAEKTNHDLKVFWVKDESTYGLGCRFSDLFEPIPGIDLIETDRTPELFDKGRWNNLFRPSLRRVAGGWKFFPFESVKDLEESGADFGRAIGRKNLIVAFSRFYPTEVPFSIFRPVATLREQIEAECRNFNKHTVGVHIRRTDHVRSVINSPTELFEQAMDEMIKDIPEANFYVASDCSKTKKLLKRKYGDWLHADFSAGDRASEAGMLRAVVELYALSRTNKILGSYWSSFSHTAADIGGIEEITIRS